MDVSTSICPAFIEKTILAEAPLEPGAGTEIRNVLPSHFAVVTTPGPSPPATATVVSVPSSLKVDFCWPARDVTVSEVSSCVMVHC